MARSVCALSIERHEGSRPWLWRTRPYANSMTGSRGFEVCSGCAVVQGTRDSMGKRSWPGKIMLSEAQWKKTEGEICWEQDREMRSELKRAKNASSRERRVMRPAVENEVEFQTPRTFRGSPSGHHIEDSAKYC